jgi:hypothetical protein
VDSPSLKPSHWYYALSLALFLVGGFLLQSSLICMADYSQQVLAPCERDLTFSEAGRYTIFYEYQTVVGERSYSSERSLPCLNCSLVEMESGRNVSLLPPLIPSEYLVGYRHGVSMLTFRIDQPGIYHLSARDPEEGKGPQVVLAVGRVGRGLVTALGLFAISALSAAAIFLMRWRSRERTYRASP